jgi:hypothetical protein
MLKDMLLDRRPTSDDSDAAFQTLFSRLAGPKVSQETTRRISGDASSRCLSIRARLVTSVKPRAGQHNNRLIHGIQPLQRVGKEVGNIGGISSALRVPPFEFHQHWLEKFLVGQASHESGFANRAGKHRRVAPL